MEPEAPVNSATRPETAKPAIGRAPDRATASIPDTLATRKVDLAAGFAPAEMLAGIGFTPAGLPGFASLPRGRVPAIFAFITCLRVNEVMKVLPFKWRAPAAAA